MHTNNDETSASRRVGIRLAILSVALLVALQAGVVSAELPSPARVFGHRPVAEAAGAPSQQPTIEGTWTTRARVDDDGDRHIQVRMDLDGDNDTRGWWVEPEELQGLSFEQFDGNVDDARFEIVREAGTTVFNGVIRNGRGTGTFAFTPNASFRQQIADLGFNDLSERQVFQAAIHDVRIAFVRELAALGYTDLATRDLFSFAIHQVTTDFIREMNQLGYADIPARQLITMRIHGVTTDWVRRVRAAMGG